MTKTLDGFENGINKSLFTDAITEKYGGISLMVAELNKSDFRDRFGGLFDLELSEGFFKALLDGTIKFENNEKGRSKLELLSEELLNLEVHQLFDRFCLISSNGRGEVYSYCTLCFELELIQELRKMKSNKKSNSYYHNSCFATYQANRRK